ncbi:MAG: hypothetical protein A2909_00230 [Candidatus Tagabacteria bacterium RIFCSPLOWO2_01_FULL_39_11]|uniref:Uncharacterized protein n=1 Tax=Candidatus Tagabacteria bacterium RIFCSPLOWO2_01_FULL_39_11 TaxID=1802295 RepID=A0A1G2LPS4_9BACT|nr:MAG: hypothetical protein A2909_00230 [Candidatus Tagabacteria bacterium RIFCSPLOWO2_01_FULL_39_11]
MAQSIGQIARILRTDKNILQSVCEKMSAFTGKKGIIEKITEKNNSLMVNRFEKLNLINGSLYSDKIYGALINKVKIDDKNIFELLKRPRCVNNEGCKTLLNFAIELAGIESGFFLKKEKAREFLSLNPPKNILEALNYKNTDELLEKEELFEIYAALRFVEDSEWLNNVFFKAYEKLKPEDFEERKIETEVLPQKWLEIAEKFLKKKYHNVSHLKELGVIFVIPLELKKGGETLRLFTLILHYLHEIDFYSKLFKRYSKEKNFSLKMISSLRGDVLDARIDGKSAGNKWMIVQRYLAKDDPYDWRLFEPHVNPEAIHWTKAEGDIAKFAKRFPNLALEFWEELDWVGDFFKTSGGSEVLVSFNLIDTVMSLVQEKEMIKYLYHHQEALWNKIFEEFIGQEKMESLIIENFDKGCIELA